MNRPLLTDFLKQYPKCPICLEHVPEKREQLLRTYSSGGPRGTKFTKIDYRCKQGHYEVDINKAFIQDDDMNGIYVQFIHFTTAYYDISICLPDDWIRICYGNRNETSRIIECNDYTKWMLTNEQMIKKLDKLWSLA